MCALTTRVTVSEGTIYSSIRRRKTVLIRMSELGNGQTSEYIQIATTYFGLHVRQKNETNLCPQFFPLRKTENNCNGNVKEV